MVATIYLRPLRRGSLDINTTAATIGEFTVSGDNPDFNWTITTTSGTVASVPAVRGTIGLGLTVTFPPAVTSGLAPPLEVTTTGTVATGTVTDLRFLDVQVAALAGTADMQQADQFDLDITYDQTQISFATSPASGTDFALASGTAANGNSAVAVATPGTVQVRLVRTATPSLLTTPTAVIRLRFSVLAGTPPPSALPPGLAPTPPKSASRRGHRSSPTFTTAVATRKPLMSCPRSPARSHRPSPSKPFCRAVPPPMRMHASSRPCASACDDPARRPSPPGAPNRSLSSVPSSV